MLISRNSLLANLLALVTLALSACLERKEHITVRPDGSVRWRATFVTDSLDELYTGDAVPRLIGGWIVQEQTERDDNGKEKFTLTAEANFKRGAELPSNYALRGQFDADACLQFPTTVHVQKRSDGTYYHFHRTYSARKFAEIDFERNRLLQEPLKGIGTEPADWTDENRLTIAKAFASFEMQKLLIFARGAFKHALPEAPQDKWLAVRDDLQSFLITMDHQAMADLIQPKKSAEDQDDDGPKRIAAETRKFRDTIEERLKNDLRALAGLDGAKVNAVMGEYDRRKKEWDVTEDLDDDAFEITVDMPGEIVASNADSQDGRRAVWQFKGEQLHDREIEMMATSRVSK
jgi:hypothetical protein